jgi:hypothetical protein
MKKCPQIPEKTDEILHFPTIYMCEKGFFTIFQAKQYVAE